MKTKIEGTSFKQCFFQLLHLTVILFIVNAALMEVWWFSRFSEGDLSVAPKLHNNVGCMEIGINPESRIYPIASWWEIPASQTIMQSYELPSRVLSQLPPL